MKRVCVISITNFRTSSRAMRTVKSMSKTSIVDYFFYGKALSKEDSAIFNENVNLYSLQYRKNGLLQKLLGHSFYFLKYSSLKKEIKNKGKKYEVVYAHDLDTSYAAYRISKSQNSKLIYDVHDLFTEILNQFFPLNSPFPKSAIIKLNIQLIKHINKKWESFFVKKSDLIVTANSHFQRYLIEKYGADNCIVTPNYPEYVEIKKDYILYKKLHIPMETKIVLYHGALNHGRNLELIIESVKFFNENIVLVIIGEGPLKEKLIALSKTNNIKSKVFFQDFVDYSMLLTLISSASLGLMLLDHINYSKKHALANKITEYMAAGVPLLATDSPENTRIIKQSNCGFIKTTNSPKELGEFINTIVENENLDKIGENGKAAFKNKFNWNLYENLFLESFKTLIN